MLKKKKKNEAFKSNSYTNKLKCYQKKKRKKKKIIQAQTVVCYISVKIDRRI